MTAAHMAGSRGETDADTNMLKYDASLELDELLMVFGGELGQLVLHERLDDGAAPMRILESHADVRDRVPYREDLSRVHVVAADECADPVDVVVG
jgi:hypothetical protein